MLAPAGRLPRWVGPFVLLDGLLSGAIGAFFAYKWITENEENVYGPCSTGDSCLTGGETLNMTFGLVFGALGVAAVLAGLWLIRHQRVRAGRDRELIERGRVGDAVITAATLTGMTLRRNGRVTREAYRLELDPGDGGAALVVNASLPPGIVAGTRVRVAYDPSSRDTVLLETPAGDVVATGETARGSLDLRLHEHPDRVERRGDVVVALRAVQRLEEEREPRAVPVGRDLHPAVVAARRAPLDPAPLVVGAERRLAVLLAPVVARVDLHAAFSRRACAG